MARPTEDTKLTVLNDHYNNTVADMKKTGRSCDKAFIAVFVLLGVMAFIVVSPDHSQGVLSQIITKKLGIDASLSLSFIGSLVWAGVLFTSISYFQAVINLEKIYNYSHRLEEELSQHYGGKAFTREGKSYLENYPIYSEWLHIIYRYIFPVLLVVVLSAKIITEEKTQNFPALPLVIDGLIFIMIVLSVVLYVYSIWRAEKDEAATLKTSPKSRQ
ncbi:MAG TPA: hypothetical protein VK983_04405 [Candidatus Limnocylindrales bacterium]|nr:hypothetical protein [Candidatus Limnocylindrales bacterium]